MGYGTLLYDSPTATYDSTTTYPLSLPFTDTPVPHCRVLWRPEQYNRVSNPGFETNTSGWSVAAGINGAGTSIVRNAGDHQSGTACGVLTCTSTDGSGMNWDFGSDRFFTADTVGTVYVAVVWLKRISGTTRARIIFGSEGTSTDRAELDVDLRDQWTPYRLEWKPTSGRTDVQLAITNGYADNLVVRVDSVAVYTVDAFSQVENGNFLANTNGWDTAGTYIAGASTSLTRQATGGMGLDATTCAQLITTATNGSGANYSLGTRLFTAGRTYRLRIAALAVSGSGNLRLRLGSNGTAADRGDSTVALGVDWSFVSVDWTPSSSRYDAVVAISNASAEAITVLVGYVEVYEAVDDVSSPYLASMRWTRGSTEQRPQTPPGTFRVTLNDSAQRFFPQNSASPLYGYLNAGRKIWCRATYAGDVYPVFQGTVRQIVPDGFEKQVDLLGEDALYDLSNLDYQAGFTENLAYWEVRSDAMSALSALHADLTTEGVEGSYYFSGNESATVLSLLEALNEATGTLGLVVPHSMAEYVWQYRTIDRATLTRTTLLDETINDDFADLSGIMADDSALENRQFVSWQSYERGTAPGDDGTGYGVVAQAVDIGTYAASAWDVDQDPYLHYRDESFGSDDNVPEPTFERVTRWTKKGRKKVRQVRIYPDALVPFTMSAGDVRTFVLDFSIPMSGTVLGLSGPTGATNIIVSTLESYPRHIVFQLFAANDDTVDAFQVGATPWNPLDEAVYQGYAYDSIARDGLHEGPAIQSPYVASAGMAEGLATYRNWRYSRSRMRPQVTVEHRFPSIVARQPGDHVSLTAARWGLSSVVETVLGIAGEMSDGSRVWSNTYSLEETPVASADWFTLDDAARGLDDPVVLAY